MKGFNRTVAFLLIFAMTFGLVPVSSVAAETTQETGDVEFGICESKEMETVLESIHVDRTEQFSSSLKESNFINENVSDNSVRRYTVLLLDVETNFTMSYSGVTIYEVATPIPIIQKAARKFIEQLQYADGTNYVAIVSYSSSADIQSGFTTDSQILFDAVDELHRDKYGADISNAFLKADELLSSVTDENAIKNVVLFTQGVNQIGNSSTIGPYTEADCNWRNSSTKVPIYRYSNVTYTTAQELMNRYNLYSVGLFQNFNDVPDLGKTLLNFAKKFSKDIQNEGYVEVDNVDDLEFAFGKVAEMITSQRGIFKYPGMLIEDADTISEYVYSDNYFCDDACEYDESLATMSLCLELASWSSYERESWPDKSINAEHLLTGCDHDTCIDDPGLGFQEFVSNEFWNSVPTKDSIGAVAANKQIIDDGKEYTLIALAIRGGGYGSEWASNLTIGETGNHAGFQDARNNVLNFLSEYINTIVDDNRVDKPNIKLWIVGYSRAGAVANMVAGAINNGVNLCEKINPVNVSDMFCYTFEAPQGVHNSEKTGTHPNIHNVLSANDLVPLVAPTVWGFSKYGKEKFTPSITKSSNFKAEKDAMEVEFKEMGYDFESVYKIPEEISSSRLNINWGHILPGGEPFILWEEVNSVVSSNILRSTVDFLAEDGIGDRSFYYYFMQEGVRDLLGILSHYDGLSAGASAKIMEMFEKENLITILMPMLSVNPFYSYEERQADVLFNIEHFLTNALIDYGELKSSIDSLVFVVERMLGTVALDLFCGNTDSFTTLIKLISFFKEAGFQPHFPEIVLAWVRSKDPNYNPNIPNNSNVYSSVSRILRINCPIDVFVYDEDNTLVATIVNDVPGEDNIVHGHVNENGEKLFYLPGDMYYLVRISASDNCSVSVSIGEHDYAYDGITRIVNYYDLSLLDNGYLDCAIPAIDDVELENSSASGSSAGYQLFSDEGVLVAANEDLRGIQAAGAKYKVSVKIEGNSGRVNGGGSFERGSFAQLEATALPSGEFIGWYVADELVSEDLVYRFAVKENTEVVAKFTEIEFFKLRNDSTKGGSITSVEGVYPAETNITVVAEPHEGYIFDHWSSTAGDFADIYDSETTFVMPDSDVVITAHWIVGDRPQVRISRLYGNNRYETAIAIANEMKAEMNVDKFDTILYASGKSFADALAGSYLAAEKRAPILLHSDSKFKDTIDYIQKNLNINGVVYILGGAAAVPERVETSLEEAGIRVERLAGTDRYVTNIEILKKSDFNGGKVLVCTGQDFADSLSVSATGLPVLLVNKKWFRPTREQIGFLEAYSGLCEFIIVGGPAAVSEDLEAYFAKYGPVERIYGASRYETSVAVAEYFFDYPESAVLAYAKNFPDGLCGGPLAYITGSPLLLTSAGNEQIAREYISSETVSAGYVLGGPSVLSDETAEIVFGLTE